MSSTIGRRLLVVSYEHPPCPGIGGTRWLSMTRYLRELGHSVTVVASDAWGGLPDDTEQEVVRVHDFRASKGLRSVFGRGKLRQEGDRDLVEQPPGKLLTHVLVPEMNVATWLPQAAFTVRRLLSRRAYDCLVTSSPPESSHLIGLLLGGKRPAWVADFRDGWTFEPYRDPFPIRSQEKLDGHLERRVATTAEVVVGATQPIADDLSQRVGALAGCVPNGWDDASAPDSIGGDPVAPDDRVTFVYTGTLSGEWGRDPTALWRALREVADGGTAVRLLHAGRLRTEERALIERSGVTELVDHLGTVDRARARDLQRSADALVLITSGNSSEATGKLFEYLFSGRPIVALAEGSEAGRIVRETNTGIVVPADDVSAVASALRRVASGELAREYSPHGLERYRYPRPAEHMAELIEEAIRRRRGLSAPLSPESPE